MSRTIFTIPQTLTFRTSSSSTAPATNMLNNEPGIVFRSSNLSNVFVQFATSGPFDVVALVGTNLRGADTFRIRAANTEAALTSAPPLDLSVGLASGNGKKAGSLLFYQLPSVVSYQYVRIDFTSTNSAGFVEVSRLVIGQCTDAAGIDTGAEISYDNSSNSYLNPLRTLPTWNMVISAITHDAYWTVWDRILMDLAEYKAFLFIPDTASSYIQPQSMFCRVVSAPKTTISSSDYYEIEMNVGTLI